MKKTLFTVKVHSMVDTITNSSSELFCTVKGTKETIEKAIEEVLKEFGCEAVELTVNEHIADYGKPVENTFDVYYDFEIHQPPCKMIEKRLREILKEYEN
jgi:hypothetical protein